MHVISVVGRSGCGKSSFAAELERVVNRAGFTVATLHTDDYYLETDCVLDYDTPESINKLQLSNHISFLSAGVTVHHGARVISAPEVLIVEGIFPLDQEVLACVQFTTDPTTAWARRIRRGNCDPRIPRWYVEEMHLLHGKPTPATYRFLTPGENHPHVIARVFFESVLSNHLRA